ncbi:hypothetical protein [Flaviflexus massiliensis]|uniref:hypothetical protein n=1 Tax=Flaviflexus massiliensis TaxID=1522309 RepID=UPI0011CA9919|nr:hypothetical protein [Flaviflexus massiliensis]
MQPLNIRVSLPLAIGLVVVGVLLLVLAIFGDQTINYFTGTILTILGTCMIFVPTIKITRNEVKTMTPIGLTVGTYPVRFPGDLAIQNKKLWHVPTNSKILSLAFGYRKADIAALEAQIYGTAQPGQASFGQPASQPHQGVSYMGQSPQQAPFNQPFPQQPVDQNRGQGRWQVTPPPQGQPAPGGQDQWVGSDERFAPRFDQNDQH